MGGDLNPPMFNPKLRLFTGCSGRMTEPITKAKFCSFLVSNI
uniref:Uncharacterized protein n=1 Tax=Anguilla anguilla TaxID=7936 RepID=A0A0E9SCH9_ANGAN